MSWVLREYSGVLLSKVKVVYFLVQVLVVNFRVQLVILQGRVVVRRRDVQIGGLCREKVVSVQEFMEV